jgi:pyrroline-5-carboxylate reductase
VSAAAKADTVALVVKPQDMGDVLDEIAPATCAPACCMVSPGRRHHDRLHRVAGARGRRGRARHAQHPCARRRGDDRDRARVALRARRDLAEVESLMSSVGKVLRIPEKPAWTP